MFRILVVDDDSAAVVLLRELIKNLQRPCELHFVGNGEEALDFLHRRGAYLDAPRPNLILLDMNMPRLGGLETLAVIKSDPELRVIPVIMLSASNSPNDVRRCYETHANCYVEKPTDLARSVKLFQAVEAFWMDLALLPAGGEPMPEGSQPSDSKGNPMRFHTLHPGHTHSGPPIAFHSGEGASSQAMKVSQEKKVDPAAPKSGCEEHDRLLDSFGVTVRELIDLHEDQFLAIIQADSDCSRFDLLIHMANEKKHLAKYAYLRHVESHGCSNLNDLKSTRT